MKKLKILLLVILVVAGANQLPAQDELNSYLVTAARNNPGLKARFNEYLAALRVAPQVKALPDPQVAFGYFIKPVETRVGPQELRVSLTQMFPWFGTLETRENVAVQAARAKYEAFAETRSKLYNDVKSTYYNLYFNSKAVDIVGENIEILEVFRRLALVKVEAGLVSPVDDYRIEMEMGDLRNQLALLTDQELVLETAFRNLLNSDSMEIIIPETLWNSDVGEPKKAILDSITSANHQLLSLGFQRQALQYRQDLARKQGMPNLSVGLDYIMVGKNNPAQPGTDAFVFPKIGITIPWYRKKYDAMVEEAGLLEEGKAAEEADRINKLETLFEKTWKEYSDADRRIILYIEQTKLAEKSINLLETEYATSGRNFEEILRMERKLLFYAISLEKARADKQAAIAFIDWMAGR